MGTRIKLPSLSQRIQKLHQDEPEAFPYYSAPLISKYYDLGSNRSYGL